MKLSAMQEGVPQDFGPASADLPEEVLRDMGHRSSSIAASRERSQKSCRKKGPVAAKRLK